MNARITSFLFSLILFTGIFACAQTSEVIKVSAIPQQQLRFGIDAERLGQYWDTDIAAPLAELGVKDLQADFVRVGISCAYELEEGKKDPSAYTNILNMMTAMKMANPDIKFFASPRPLWVAYGTKNGIPWSPYPLWIQEWQQNGTVIKNNVEYPKWKKGEFHVDKLIGYYADYLNFMYQKGFSIAYMDLSNEQSIITPALAKEIADKLPGFLQPGVKMPELVVPSTWDNAKAIEWLKSVDLSKNEQTAFSIASAHNTGGEFMGDEMAAEARRLNKEAWNTELHRWVGVESKEEILTSAILWQYLRSGFNGFDTWLFYGPYEGRGHTMIWADHEKGIRKSTKYEIFKNLVNTSNRGFYLNSSVVSPDLLTTVFIKGKDLTIWILNTSSSGFDNVCFDLSEFNIASTIIEKISWNEVSPRAGIMEYIVNDNKSLFTTPVGAESLYFFKLRLE